MTDKADKNCGSCIHQILDSGQVDCMCTRRANGRGSGIMGPHSCPHYAPSIAAQQLRVSKLQVMAIAQLFNAVTLLVPAEEERVDAIVSQILAVKDIVEGVLDED